MPTAVGTNLVEGTAVMPQQFFDFSLPEDLLTRLRENGDHEICPPHVLVAAMRILDFRYSNVEKASVGLYHAGTTSSYALYIHSSMPLEQIVDTARWMMEKGEAEGGSDAKPEMIVEVPRDESKDDAKLRLMCNSAQHSSETMGMLSVNLIDILRAIVTTPILPVMDIEFPHALDQLRRLKIPLKQPWPCLVPNNIPEAFEQIVRRHGSEIALVQQTLYLTYEQVHIISTRLAGKLRAEMDHSQSSNNRIGFCLPPSALAVITLLAIVKAGCAYVPLDIRDPPGRRLSILADSGASCLVVTNGSPEFPFRDDSRVPVIDITSFLDDWKDMVSQPAPPMIMEHQPKNDIVCLIYTSGTTGKPKGVRITHRNMLSFASNKDIMPLGPGTKMAQVNNLAWDAHLIDTWTPMLSGATLFCFSRFDVLDPTVLSTLFHLAEIDTCFFPAALYRHILTIRPQLFACLKRLMIGGELSQFESIQEIRAVNPDLTIINLYGPTETTAFVTKYFIGPDPPPKGPLPIGTPTNISRVHVVDPRGRLVPPGVTGEILIGGDGVADGYHDRPQETTKAFIETAMKGLDISPSMFYRTGDRARWSFDGQIEFLGRINTGQIKIRGQRLELSEVESTIVRATGVRDAGVVSFKPSNRADAMLVAYLVPQPKSPEVNDLDKNSRIITTWTEFYDESYSGDIEKIRKEFIGWDSMITGQQIPSEEMEDWLKDTLRPFFERGPRTVFEVGCGIGIILYEMLPFVEHFYAVEPSAAGVERLQANLRAEGHSNKVSVWHSSADKVQDLRNFQMDFALINSVTQYYPSEDYLRDSLLQLVRRCNPGGHIMLGDVRSASLDDFLAIDIIMEQWKDTMQTRTVQDLLDRVAERRQYRTELLIDPGFFFELQREEPQITHVEIIPKLMSHNNELSRYRYQVILHIQGDQPEISPKLWVSPDANDSNFTALPQLLDNFVAGDDPVLAVERIPNRFFAREEAVATKAYAPSTEPSSPLTFLSTLETERKGWSALDLDDLANSRGLSVRISSARQAESTCLDAVFTKASPAPLVSFKVANSGCISHLPTSRTQVGREPIRLRNFRYRDLLGSMKTNLPSHMMPEQLYGVEWLPLTSNGKLDRRMLAEMAMVDYQRTRGASQGFAGDGPQNETESIVCDLFSEILSGVTVTRSTDFFAQGGHSLLATRLRSALEREFKVAFPLQDLFTKANPATIARKIQNLQQTEPSLITRVERNEITGNLADLSFAQGRLWFLHQLVPGETEYICPWLLYLHGDLDEAALEQTIVDIAMRHEILRTIFIESDGVPKSKVTDIVPKLERLTLDPKMSEEDVKSIVMDRTIHPFDISTEPCIHPILFKLGPKRYIFSLTMHHIVTDGASYDVLRHELIETYKAIVEGRSPSLPELPIQYKDFAQWQHSPEFNDLIERQEEYWVSYLRGGKPARFPADHERTSVFHNEAGMFKLTCEPELRDKLWALCQRQHVTWFMLLLSAFRAVHYQWTGASDASLGSPIANRHRSEVEQLLGFFVNTQVFRIRVHQGQAFTDLLRNTRELALKAFEHQDVPFDRLVELLDPPRSALQNPLIEIMFAFQSFNMTTFNLPNVDAEWFGFHRGTTRFDLELHWWERVKELECVFFYRKAVFEDATIARLAEDIKEVLRLVVDNANFRLYSDKADLDESPEAEDVVAHHTFADETALEPDGPPESEIEEQVCLTFENLLGISDVTRQTNFFDCGGHSLLVTRACSQLKQHYNVQLEIRDIFERPTPVGLARHIERLLNEDPDSPSSSTDSLKDSGLLTGVMTPDSAPSGSEINSAPSIPRYYAFTDTPGRPYLFCIPACSGISTIYSGIARAATNFNVIGVNDPSLTDSGLRHDSSARDFNDLARTYYDEVLKLEKELQLHASVNENLPPLNLLGFSAGGSLALEMARDAIKDGRKVNLFIIDAMRNELAEVSERTSLEISNDQIERAISISTDLLLTDLTDSLGSVYRPDEHAALLDMARSCTMSNLRRFYRYSMKPYPEHATFFRTEANISNEFTGLLGSVDDVLLSGHHFGLLDARIGQTGVIAEKVGQVIAPRA